MAGSGSLNLVIIDCHTIDVQYSFNITGSGRQGYLVIVGDESTQPDVFLGAGFQEGTYRYSNLTPNELFKFYLYDFKNM